MGRGSTLTGRVSAVSTGILAVQTQPRQPEAVEVRYPRVGIITYPSDARPPKHGRSVWSDLFKGTDPRDPEADVGSLTTGADVGFRVPRICSFEKIRPDAAPVFWTTRVRRVGDTAYTRIPKGNFILRVELSLAPSRSRSRSLGSFRPGSKVNQARPGTQDIHLPQGVAFHRSARSPDVAAVQLARFTSLPPRGTPLLFSRVLVLSTPSNLNSPQQGDLGGQGLRHGPSPAPQAAQAVREGSRSSGSHSRLSRRRGAAHPASSSTTGGGGGRRRPRGRDPSPGRAPALTGPLASKFKFPPAGGSRGPGPPPRPQPGTASRPGGQGGLPVLRFTLALRAPVRRRSPRALLHDRRGGGRRHPRGRDPPAGRAPALTRPLAAPRPAADDFVGAPKPTSDPPGTTRSGRHLELLFTGAAGSSYEGEPPAFHQFVPPDFSTGPRDTGAPCIALSAPLDHSN
ncbi:hypothetical protein NDU88_005458 [Pleurodeles waltl]|uniref:Uncharacterized protein n=1 Tax=Pleurodeles waltl TaxID=8319 RepID=A0AAV7VK07_PLEWA|nr:hypothetical protein NDU88_005458 [Pleurodeles waltl]